MNHIFLVKVLKIQIFFYSTYTYFTVIKCNCKELLEIKYLEMYMGGNKKELISFKYREVHQCEIK